MRLEISALNAESSTISPQAHVAHSEACMVGLTRWIVCGLMLPLFGVIGFNFSRLALESPSTPFVVPELPSFSSVAEPPAAPVSTVHTSEFVIRPNDTLDGIFRNADLSLTDLAAIRALPEARGKLDLLRPGDLIQVSHEGDAVQSLERQLSDTELLWVTRTDAGFTARVITTPIEVRVAHAQGTIDSSLFNAARAAGLSAEVVMRLANEVFGWDIDFALEIQRGDRFTVVYEQKYRNGEYLGAGKILAADFVNAGELHQAVWFASAGGQIADYYSRDGRSMHRQFLRAPLDFTRVSSEFNLRRRHPILNTVRAHRGVDYAAPSGTVIKAAGEGRVTFAGKQTGYGNVVILEHGRGISTLYGHMSRFAAQMRKGQSVRQGQTIGYVGSTGAATGPHLHYEYRVNGVHMNPRSVKLPQALPISSEFREEFVTQTTPWLAQLDALRAGHLLATERLLSNGG